MADNLYRNRNRDFRRGMARHARLILEECQSKIEAQEGGFKSRYWYPHLADRVKYLVTEYAATPYLKRVDWIVEDAFDDHGCLFKAYVDSGRKKDHRPSMAAAIMERIGICWDEGRITVPDGEHFRFAMRYPDAVKQAEIAHPDYTGDEPLWCAFTFSLVERAISQMDSALSEAERYALADFRKGAR